MASIDELNDKYGSDNVTKAFWLQERIKERGLDGIHFMEEAEVKAKQVGPMITHQAIRSELSKRF